MTDETPNPKHDEAKARVAAWIDDPKHKRAKGSPDDEATRDDAVPNEENP